MSQRGPNQHSRNPTFAYESPTYSKIHMRLDSINSSRSQTQSQTILFNDYNSLIQQRTNNHISVSSLNYSLFNKTSIRVPQKIPESKKTLISRMVSSYYQQTTRTCYTLKVNVRTSASRRLLERGNIGIQRPASDTFDSE